MSTRRRNQNLAPDEAAVLREIAAYHGYTQKSGQQAGNGSVLGLTLAIVHGDIQTVSLDEDELRRVVPWLSSQAADLMASDPILADVLAGLAAQLGACVSEQVRVEAPAPTAGPIDTMDG